MPQVLPTIEDVYIKTSIKHEAMGMKIIASPCWRWQVTGSHVSLDTIGRLKPYYQCFSPLWDSKSNLLRYSARVCLDSRVEARKKRMGGRPWAPLLNHNIQGLCPTVGGQGENTKLKKTQKIPTCLGSDGGLAPVSKTRPGTNWVAQHRAPQCDGNCSTSPTMP
ncbi:hypothetical protein GOP47_0000172 [Adiantum capillus-veneris]|uniref:Uncharacterized protein n=1 Tax=Adiantum capillus-veneris TaxID=13818 RepID=A0A9D4VEG5_ADICA|nr:hypothetical protein GOP47_0000172 [Adiantum capillus-veneris]